MCPLGMAIPPFPVIARYEAISPLPVIARNVAISPFPVIARNMAISPFMSTPLWGLRAQQSCHHDLILSLRAERGNLTLSCHREERGDLALHLNAPLGVASTTILSSRFDSVIASGAWQSHPFLSSRGTWRSRPSCQRTSGGCERSVTISVVKDWQTEKRDCFVPRNDK
jgi:hypothetical protein